MKSLFTFPHRRFLTLRPTTLHDSRSNLEEAGASSAAAPFPMEGGFLRDSAGDKDKGVETCEIRGAEVGRWGTRESG